MHAMLSAERGTLCLWQAIAEVCAVCNEARIECKEGVFRAVGAPTEAALVVLAEKLGVPHAQQQAAIAAARKSDPDTHADGVQRWYNAKCVPLLFRPPSHPLFLLYPNHPSSTHPGSFDPVIVAEGPMWHCMRREVCRAGALA